MNTKTTLTPFQQAKQKIQTNDNQRQVDTVEAAKAYAADPQSVSAERIAELCDTDERMAEFERLVVLVRDRKEYRRRIAILDKFQVRQVAYNNRMAERQRAIAEAIERVEREIIGSEEFSDIVKLRAEFDECRVEADGENPRTALIQTCRCPILRGDMEANKTETERVETTIRKLSNDSQRFGSMRLGTGVKTPETKPNEPREIPDALKRAKQRLKELRTEREEIVDAMRNWL